MTPYSPQGSERSSGGRGPRRLWPRRTVLGWALIGGGWGVVGRHAKTPWGGFGPVAGSPQALVRKMSLDEKIGLVHGVIQGPYVGYVPGLARLKIPALTLVDGPAGVRFGGSHTAMPAPIVLAATFDPDRATAYAQAIAAEARASGNNVLFAPGMNMARVWQGGRNFEYFGEDPRLTSTMAAAYVSAVQGAGLIAVAKHFICNDQEANRHAVSVSVSDRALHEIYLPPFLAAVAAGAGAVMAANNRFRGTYCTQNAPLLLTLLEGQASFAGFVVSDYGATHDAIAAANGGLDLDMPDAANFGAPLRAAVLSGKVRVSVLNDKVVRILRSMNSAGLRGHRPPAPVISPRAVALDVASAGCVLLQNSGLLPLSPSGTIAVLGRPAAEPAAGLGSSRVEPTRIVAILDAMRSRLGSAVTYTEGASIGTPVVVANRFLAPPGAPAGTHGVRSEFYANRSFTGSPIVDSDSEINVYTGAHAPRPGLPAGNFSVRYTATLTAPTSGTYAFTLTGTARLVIDGRTVVDLISSSKNPSTGSIVLTAGSHSLTVEAVSSAAAFVAQLTWVVPGSPEANPSGALAAAVALAAASDAAVVVVSDLSGEGRDRTTYSLPGNQDTLISQVLAANPRTAVVLTTSAPVSVENWIAATPAALWAGYHGQEGGEAVASLLFGESNPAGKLPITWAKSANDYPATTPQQYPGVNNVETYSEGIYIGYRHFDQAGITPRFPFGHGLSYTTFGYSGLTISTVSPGVWTIGAMVKNTGARSGTELVQLYAGPAGGSSLPVDMPSRQLVGFRRIDLAAGQSTPVSFSLTAADLEFWNESAGTWQSAPGTYVVELGDPSGQQLTGQVVVS